MTRFFRPQPIRTWASRPATRTPWVRPFPPHGDLAGGVLFPVYAPTFRADGIAGRIQFGLKPFDYYGAWCALQKPIYSLKSCSTQASDAGTGPIVNTSYGYDIISGSVNGYGTDLSGNQYCTIATDSSDCTSTATAQNIDCGKWNLASSHVCACTAGGCTAAPSLPSDTAPVGYPVEFDGTLDSTGMALTGTLGGFTVHLTRQ